MVLVPKVADAITINQFRHIILSNFCFKIITKILGDRLANIAIRIMSCNQFGFLKNCQILDCIVGASQGVNLLNKTYEAGRIV